MTIPFDRSGDYYDLLYADKDYRAEARFVASRLPHGKLAILELGCGSGIHATHLAELGHSVTGVDRSPTMLRRAMERVVPGDSATGHVIFCDGDARFVRLDRRFDAVISLFHVVSYQVEDGDVAAMLATAAEHLQPGGILFFDVWYGPAVLYQRPSIRVKRMHNAHLSIIRIAEPVLRTTMNVVDVHYEAFVTDLASGHIECFKEEHAMRYFSLAEISALGRAAGFSLERAEEWVTGRNPSEDTWSVCFTMRKRV